MYTYVVTIETDPECPAYGPFDTRDEAKAWIKQEKKADPRGQYKIHTLYSPAS